MDNHFSPKWNAWQSCIEQNNNQVAIEWVHTTLDKHLKKKKPDCIKQVIKSFHKHCSSCYFLCTFLTTLHIQTPDSDLIQLFYFLIFHYKRRKKNKQKQLKMITTALAPAKHFLKLRTCKQNIFYLHYQKWKDWKRNTLFNNPPTQVCTCLRAHVGL